MIQATSVWYALLAPAATPQAVVADLNAGVNAYLASPKALATFADLGIEAGGGTPGQLSSFIDAEIAKWAPIIEAANISF